MSVPFLTARWSHLFLATYAVPAALLEHRLPVGLTLDLRDGQACVSLVAFEFRETRVLGVPWPGYRDFAELNLRFYVRRGTTERGVVFVREIVPLRLVSWVARAIYHEPYRTAPLTSRVREEESSVTAEYCLEHGGRTHTLRVTGGKPPYRPSANSTEHFFKEHQWGYGVSRCGRTLRYAVEHPVWDVYPVQSYVVDLDWCSVYGAEWAPLNLAQPISTVFAVGSAVKVFPKGKG